MIARAHMQRITNLYVLITTHFRDFMAHWFQVRLQIKCNYNQFI